jgi:archaellum component FlaF (FlaF/FlaG flagellin family)
LDKILVTIFMTIAGVVSAVLVFNAIYPTAVESGAAMTGMERRIDERLKSQIEIIHATGKSTNSDVSVWVKNIGSLRVTGVERCDVFFGLEGSFGRIPYGNGEGPPYWEYELENNDTEWNPSATLKILIRYGGTYPSAGRHFLKVVLPNGISDEYYFHIE